MKKRLLILALAFLASPAWAGTQTVTLSVPGMTCAACPITVKTALAKVAGVEKTKVNFDKREVIVTYDDAKASVKNLTEATKNVGYPSSVKGL
jgi:mercuric ion binding protein